MSRMVSEVNNPKLSGCFGLIPLSCAYANQAPDEGLRQAAEGVMYMLDASGQGTYHGANPAQQFSVEFDGHASHRPIDAASDADSSESQNLSGHS